MFVGCMIQTWFLQKRAVSFNNQQLLDAARAGGRADIAEQLAVLGDANKAQQLVCLFCLQFCST
jgi:hypothetical protein